MLAADLQRHFVLDWKALPGCNCSWRGLSKAYLAWFGARSLCDRCAGGELRGSALKKLFLIES